MIKNNIKTKKISANLSLQEINDIKKYIKGAVYSFCNNCKEENGENRWFAAYNLFGEDNYYWQSPLNVLYNYYINVGKSQSDAIKSAGIDIGCLLKEVLMEDNRIYIQDCCQRKFIVNKYRLEKI